MSNVTKLTFRLLDLVVIFAMIFGSPMSALAQDPAPVLTTDKSDYAPGESAKVMGSGFTPGDEYTVAANGTEWGKIPANEVGTFEFLSPILEEGTYEVNAVAASGGTVVASVAFTVTAPAPTDSPTEAPTATESPTVEATQPPTEAPTATEPLTAEPTATEPPTTEPTAEPTQEPIATDPPTAEPTQEPVATDPPTAEATQPTTDTPTDEPTSLPPYIQSDKADYAPGELVTLTGGNWQGDTQVRIFVNDDLAQTWFRDVIVDVAADGTVIDSFNLPAWFVATYKVAASGQQTGRVVTSSFTDAAEITLSGHRGQQKAADGTLSWPSGSQNTTTYAETEPINFRFEVTTKVPGAVGQVQIEFSKEDAICDFFDGTLVLGTWNNEANPVEPITSFTTLPTVSLDSTTVVGTDYVATLTVQFSDPGTAYVYYYLRVSDNVTGCTGSSQHSRISPASDNVGPSGAQNVPVPADKIIRLPEITVIKNIDRDGDGSFEDTADAGEYCFALDGGACSATDGLGQVVFTNVTPDGAHTITETQLDFSQGTYNFVSGSGTNCTFSGSTATATVASGTTSTNATCTFNNAQQQGTVIVKKVMVGGTDSFTFTGTPSGSISTNNGTISANVNPGQYQSTETVPAGWDLTSVTCDDSDSTGNVGTKTATFNVSSNETVTCTFTNTKRGHIIVDKVTVPSGNTTSFAFTTTGTGYSGFNLTDADTPNDQTLVPGNYSVSETVPSGWSLSSSCTSSISDAESPGAIELDAGETVTCTFTNTKQFGSIVVIKDTVPNDPQDFSFTGTGPGGFNFGGGFSLDDDGNNANDLSNSKTFSSLDPGNYSVSESSQTGFDTVSSCTSSIEDTETAASIELDPNETVTCTFTNTKRGTIIVVKNTVGGDGTFDFTSETLPDFSLTTVSNTASQTFSDLDVDVTYDVAETVPAGWELNSATCDSGETIDNIDVGPGETVTCTFTNAKVAIAITKTADASTVGAGDPIGFTIAVTSTGAGTAQNVMITDTLPTNAGLNWSIDGANSDADCSIQDGVLTCNFGNIPGGTSKSVHITSPTTADSCGTVDNTAQVTTDNDGSGEASDSITVNCPRVTITKTADAAIVSAGDIIGFTITVSNAGPGEAKGVMISDSLPGGLSWSIDSANTTATGCSITSGTLTCGPDTIASGSSIQVHVTAVSTPLSCGMLSNSATATPTNGAAATSQTATITVNCPDLTITKTGNGPISAGDTATFTITVTNNGAGVAKGVTLTDTLPSGLTWAIDAGNTTATGCTITAGTLTCGPDIIASGSSVKITVSAVTTKDNCGALNNTATVAATNEADTSNNSGTGSITVQCTTITINKKADATPVNAGDPLGFTIEVTNPGPGNAYGVMVTDNLAINPGLAWEISPTVSGCSITAGVLTCNFGTMAAGATQSVHISSPTTAASCGQVPNAAYVTTTNDGGGSATDVISVFCPDVTVAKAAASDTVSAGDSISFEITVKNTGAGTAKGVTLSDTLPTGGGLDWLVGGTDAADCSITSGVVICDFGDMPSAAIKTITLTSPTTAASCATINNTATVAATNEPTGQTNNSSTASITVLCARISILKRSDPASGVANAGDTIFFQVDVVNEGEGIAKNVVISDTLPDNPGLHWALSSLTKPSSSNGSCNISTGSPQVLTCTFDQLVAHQSIGLRVASVTTLATACATIDNTASVTTSNDGTGEASATIEVTCPNVGILKRARPDSGVANAGDTIQFQIDVFNTGLSAASNVVITDTLPDNPGLHWMLSSLSKPDSSTGSCSVSTGSPQVLTCTFDQLAAGQSIGISVASVTTYATCGIVSNTASYSTSNDGSGTTIPATTITVNCPALEVTKTPDTQTVSAGEPITFTVTVTNTGAGTAKNVTLSDQLPQDMTWSVNNSDCSVGANGLLTCDFGDLPPISSAPDNSVSVTVTGDTIPAMCGTLDNTATIKLDNGPDVTSNTVSVTVNCPDVTVSKEAVSGTINAGDTAAFKIVVTNSGTGTAYGVTLTDTLPAGVTWMIDPAVTGCSITGNTLSCSFATLAADASITINVKGITSAAVCGKLDNTVTVAASNEANTSNNSANATIIVNCAQIGLTKVPDSEFANAGDIIGFTITVTNSGAGTAYNVGVSDTLPTNAGMDWTIDPAVQGCSIASGVLTCSVATLASGASISIHITSPTTPDSCGALENTAVATTSNDGTAHASATIFLSCPNVDVFKFADNSPINAGDVARFTITVANTEMGTAYDVTLTDNLPAGVTWSEDSPYCSISGGVLSCDFGDLVGGGYRTVHVSGTTNALACGVLTNTATVAASNEPDDSQTDNSSMAVVTVNCPVDLTVSKTANPAFKRTFAWSIAKDVDPTLIRQIYGSSAIFNYSVTVAETGFTDSDWIVTGKITVTNPNDWIDIPLTSLTDTVDNGGTCTVKDFTAGTSVPKSDSLTFDYTCTYSSKPDPYAGINTATATWDSSIGTAHGSASNTANFAFDTNAASNPTNINKTVTVTDTFNGTTSTLGTVTATTTQPYTTKTFTYKRTIPVTWYPCKSYTNTATIDETGQTASQTVTVCGPLKTGALTIGYWQNKNGQNIIKNAGALSGVCKLTPWLRGFAPFQDLSTKASCTTVASYITNVIKAANARGASMNAMLKAQMLATALDVYFSDPALGGNKIKAPAPIGGVTIDLTYIYVGGKYINVSAAFGGATSMKVMDMLTYAASQLNPGGTTWYGNNKSIQELAKDAFDAINNNWVFPP